MILRYLSVVMVITGLGFVSVIFQSGSADGDCFSQIAFYLWYIVYPLVFFKTIQSDSDYHWSYASRPFLESTQQSIADLDLFALPGYHGGIESAGDTSFRFKKLKQMVSGYVAIIPFKKIKFDRDDPSCDDHDDGRKRRKGTIGAGSTSKVYCGTYKGHPVAVKCLSRHLMSWTDLTLIFRESILSSSLSHPNVVQFMGASLTLNGFFLVYEYCTYGDLQVTATCKVSMCRHSDMF